MWSNSAHHLLPRPSREPSLPTWLGAAMPPLPAGLGAAVPPLRAELGAAAPPCFGEEEGSIVRERRAPLFSGAHACCGVVMW